ncbi:hypothetical protein BC940DRAFT_316760 [Gongronella butleri]|nr:hypothetical protein BC940DRAFT_316760 [Gongronella butleri]
MASTLLRRRASQHRSLWIGHTGTGPTLDSSVDACLAPILGQLAKHQRPTVCVALMSKSFVSGDYERAMSKVEDALQGQDTAVARPLVLGCVVDRVPEYESGVSLLIGVDEQVQPFHVAHDPHAPRIRTISVGRWGAVQDFDRFKYQGNALDKQGWAAFDSISQPPTSNASPDAVFDALPPNANFCWLMSDREPESALQAVDNKFADAQKMGIVASSTPFVTGTPHWMYFQGTVVPAGTIGFASYASEKNTPATRAPLPSSLAHPALEPMGAPVAITRVRGNVILDLDDQGATAMLLDLIHGAKHTNKDESFYLAIQPFHDATADTVVARITSGDPARGNMAVDTTLDLHVGQKVQFLQKTTDAVTPTDLLRHAPQDAMVFGTVDLDHTIDVHPPSPHADTRVSAIFGATSENGLLLGAPGQPTLLHQVPFASLHVARS